MWLLAAVDVNIALQDGLDLITRVKYHGISSPIEFMKNLKSFFISSRIHSPVRKACKLAPFALFDEMLRKMVHVYSLFVKLALCFSRKIGELIHR